MTMRQILHYTLIFMVLVTAGCDRDSDPTASSKQDTNSQTSPRLENKNIEFAVAEERVRAAVAKLKSPTSTAIVKSVKDDINDAIKKLGKDERERCTNCKDETKEGALEALLKLNTALGALKDPQKKILELEPNLRTTLQQNLTAEADKLKNLGEAEPKAVESPAFSPPAIPADTSSTQTSSGLGLWGLLMTALPFAGGLVILGLLAFGLTYVWKRSWKTVEYNVGQVLKAHLAAARETQPDYVSKFSSLSSSQAEMSSRLNALDSEVRSLARLVRESLSTRRSDPNPSYGSFSYPPPGNDGFAKDEPEFPVSAVDYLGKMDRFVNVVRPDFQNGILVNDPEGNGELVLIRDSRLPDETQPLFVVPRATQFHTKQDFYTYYQKYYECIRPAAGAVWIIDPAVVEKVSGGWQLREKGTLEVR